MTFKIFVSTVKLKILLGQGTRRIFGKPQTVEYNYSLMATFEDVSRILRLEPASEPKNLSERQPGVTVKYEPLLPCVHSTIRYEKIYDLHWKTDRQAASLI